MLLYVSKNLADQLAALYVPRVDELSFTETEQRTRTFLASLEATIKALFGAIKGSVGRQLPLQEEPSS